MSRGGRLSGERRHPKSDSGCTQPDGEVERMFHPSAAAAVPQMQFVNLTLFSGPVTSVTSSQCIHSPRPQRPQQQKKEEKNVKLNTKSYGLQEHLHGRSKIILDTKPRHRHFNRIKQDSLI